MTSLIELRDEVNLEIQTNPGYKTSSPTLIDKNINRAIKRIVRDFYNQLPYQRATYEFTTVAGQKTYDLPEDFDCLATPVFVRVGDRMASPTNETTIEPSFINFGIGGLDFNFYLNYSDGWKINFAPIPSFTDDVKLVYNKILPDLTEQQDSPLPKDFDELIVNYAVYLTVRRLRGNEGKAADYYNEYLDLLPAVRAKVARTNPQANHWGGQYNYSRNFNRANPNDRYA